MDPESKARFNRLLIFLAALCVVFFRPLLSLVEYSVSKDLDSYIVLIPFVSAYLLNIERGSLMRGYFPAPVWAGVSAIAGLAALAAGWHWKQSLSENDSLTFFALGFVCFIILGGFVFLGRRVMAAAAFPFGFLFFLAPLPGRVVDTLETASKLASADAAAFFFSFFGVPVLRDGTVFQIPGITIRVAQECSGIHSSWILIIASLIACHLVLRSYWRRAILLIFAIVLGVIRNGFRIATIGWLCVHIGPRMIDSPIHHRGGPIFFVLSLIPLFILLWALCKGERKRLSRSSFRPGPAGPITASGLQ
jgi:exosortase C (VPDSG-CTERM-specific)